MKYRPHDPDFWHEVDRRQVERREQELMSDKIIDHYTGCDLSEDELREWLELRLRQSDDELDYNNADIPRRYHNEER